MDTQALRLMIRAEAQQAIKELDRVKDTAAGAESAALKLGDALSAAAFAAGVATIKAGVDAFIAQERALVKLNAVYRATGGAVGLSLGELESFASELQSTTGIADDAAMEMQALLLTFKNIQGEGFKDTARLALDLAAVMGGDVRGAAMQLGKALEDPINGLSALRRSGVSFTQAQQETIKALVESNRLAEAQGIILKAVEGQVGGTAVALSQTLGGAIDQANAAFGDLLEIVGEGFAPLIRAAADGAKALALELQGVPAPVLAAGTAFVTMTAGINTATAAATAMGVKIPAALGPVGLAIAGITAAVVALSSELDRVNRQLEDQRARASSFQELSARIEAGSASLADYNAAIEILNDNIGRLRRGQQSLNPVDLALNIFAGDTIQKKLDQYTERLTNYQRTARGLAQRQAEANREIADSAAAMTPAAASTAALGTETEDLSADLEEAARQAAKLGDIFTKTADASGLTTMGYIKQKQALIDATLAARDMEDVINSMSGDGDAKGPFAAIAAGASGALDVLNKWQPAINAFGATYSAWADSIRADNERIIRSMERAMEMDQQRFENQIALARAAGQTTTAIEQAAADAKYRAEVELDAKRAKLEKEAFERDKLAKIASITMATAQGIANALSMGYAGIPLAAIVAAAGTVQTAIVASQQYPGLADGGTVTRGGMTLVGERGPELLNLPRGSSVIPLDGSASGVTVIIQGGTFIGSGGLDEAVTAIKRRMDQLQRTGQL